MADMDGRPRYAEPLDMDWAIDANCAGVESSLFFDPEHEHEAKAICAGCEVRAECLAASYALNARDGIWGGEGWEARKRLRRAEQRIARNAR